MKLLVTGGCGYVGTQLVNQLLSHDHSVTVLDTMWFGNYLRRDEKLRIVKSDIRDINGLDRAGLFDVDVIFHLANIANDPSSEIDPKLTWEVNVLGSKLLVEAGILNGVKRFIYASSGSVYGVKEEENVTEDLDLDPISDYNKTKMVSERVLMSYKDDIEVYLLRPATVCGYSPRMRLDLTVNLLTRQAIEDGVITVFGGDQIRPNVHINDMVDSYLAVLDAPTQKINGQIFNVGFKNQSVNELANDVKEVIGSDVKIIHTKSDDNRSYHVSSEKIRDVLNFNTKYTVKDAVSDLKNAFEKKSLINTFNDEFFFNIKRMQSINLK